MKKFWILVATVLCWQNAIAQETEMPKVDADAMEFADEILNQTIEQMRVPDDVLKNLDSCSPFEKEFTVSLYGMKQNNTYKVYPDTESQSCILETRSTSMGINSLQKCKFSEEDRKLYIKSLKALYGKKKLSMAELFSDDNYLFATGIMMNPEVCETTREEVDLTKKIRENLKNCTPAEDTLDMGMMVMSRKILGKKAGKCQYTQTIVMKMNNLPQTSLTTPLIEQMENKEMKIEYKCDLDEKQQKELIKLFESQVIPAGDVYDMSATDSLGDSSEQDFLGQYCEIGMPSFTEVQ